MRVEFAAVLIAIVPFAAVAQAPHDASCAAKSAEAAVVELLEVSDVFARARAESDDVVAQLRVDNPQVPAEYWPNVAQRLADRKTLESVYVPIYLRHLSHEDVCRLVQLYRTPAGARFLQIDPKAEERTRSAAQAWTANVVLGLLDPSQASATVKTPAPGVPTPAPQGADQTAARMSDVQELLRLSGTLASARTMIEHGLEGLQRQTQSLTLPAAFWGNVRERLTNENDLLRLWAPAYARQLTSAQVAELLEFYRSPAGVRYTAAIPAIQAESVAAGTQLARDAAKGAVRQVFGPLPQWKMLHPSQPPPAPGAKAP